MCRYLSEIMVALAVVGALIAGGPAPAWAQTSDMARASQAYPTGNPDTSIVMLERMVPAQVRVGTMFTYEIHVRNLTDGTIENMTMTERLPSPFTVDSIEPEPVSMEGGMARWTGLTLGPKKTLVAKVRGMSPRTGELEGCHTVSFQTVLCQKNLVVEPALELAKTAPDEVLLCDPIPMTLTVRNNGSGPADGVKIVDTLPSGWTTTNGQQSVTLDVGTLAAGQSREFSMQAKSSETGSFVNRAVVTESGGTSANAQSTTVVRKPVLEVTKAGPQMRYLGLSVRYQLTVRNTGDAPARDTMLVDTLDPDVTFRKASDEGKMAGGQVTWSLGTIEPAQSRTVELVVVSTKRKTVRNTAKATAYCAEASAIATTVIKGIPAILLEVVDLTDPIEVGSDVTYVVTVTNQGSAEGTNVVIECNLADEQKYVSADGPTEAKVDGGTIRFAPLASLAVGAKAEYRVVAKGLRPQDVRFRVSMRSDQLKTDVHETESTNIYE